MKQGGYRQGSSGFTNSGTAQWRFRGAGGRIRSAGFTLVEVMIVLAVTGVMFVSAVLAINGRQNKTEFTTGINDLQQRLQQIVNETASGFYPNNNDFTCERGSSPYLIFQNTNADQGTNGDCMFLGKAIQFGTASSRKGQLGIMPLVGFRNSAMGTPALTINDTMMRALYPSNLEATEFVPTDAAVYDQMENGLEIADSNGTCDALSVPNSPICYTEYSGSKPTVAAGTIGFVAGDSNGDIASTDGSSMELNSGSQQLSLYGVKFSAPNEGLPYSVGHIGHFTEHTASNIEPASKFYLCVASATTDQSGLFTFDAGLHVTLDIKNGRTC